MSSGKQFCDLPNGLELRCPKKQGVGPNSKCLPPWRESTLNCVDHLHIRSTKTGNTYFQYIYEMNNISNLLDYFHIEEVEDEGADIY